MNCQEFQSIVHDWCQPSLDPGVRRDGLGHAATCAKCAILLASVQSLAVGLWALAEASVSAEASPSVEKALLQAFEREHRRKGAPRTPSRWELARWTASRWVLAVGVATALVMVGLGVQSWRAHQRIVESQHGQSRVAPPSNSGKEQLAAGGTLPEQGQVATAADQRRNSVPRAGVAPQKALQPTSELATDFLPLGGVLDPMDFEQAELVRVSLPASALVDLGMNVNEEAGAATITAEVLIGEDGTARGIRFLR